MIWEESVVTFVGATVIAALVTTIGDTAFNQHWNFFIVWLICLAVAFGGFLIIDNDGDWDIL